MSTEPQRTCPSCGNEFSGAMEFCPVCMLRKGLARGVESGESSFEEAVKPTTSEQVLQRFEHYQLVTGEDGKPVELGRGAMGVTYKAFDINLRCPVTLKVISERYLSDESARLRFLREARAAASVRHPNVASVFHLGRTGQNYFYAMEFVEGETLEHLIKRSGRLDVKLALEIATQVAGGLAAIHEQNLVHRDIKPTNIMVRLKEEGTAKIIDLGLAKTLDETASETGISSPGTFVGTPEFASPEQFAGIGVDIRSDLYSLGVTLWMMVTDHPPFRGPSAEVMYQHQHSPLPFRRLNDVSQPVVVLLEKLLEKDPAQRFQTPNELLKAIPTITGAIDARRRITRKSLQKTPSTASRVVAHKSPVRLAPKKISVARLPITGSEIFGREEDITFLDRAWAKKEVNVVTIVAWAGVGKSTLVNHWLRRMAAKHYRSAELVFGWSFYRQGISRDSSSADEFLDAALTWFGDPDPRLGTPWEKGERLAKLISHRRTLLILDGLEPLQNPPGPQEGRLREPSLQALLRELAAFNTGLCVITTRTPVADIADHEGISSALRRELEQLSSDAGAKLLRTLGVKGPEAELRSASDEFSGHCLALTLLGSYLADAYQGDIRCRSEVSGHLAHDVRQGVHARKVMESYQTWFGKGPEPSVLRILGLFDRPADEKAIGALLKSPAIPGLSESLVDLSPTEWRMILAKLRRAKLLTQEDPHNPGYLDTHPLVREYFGEQLRSQQTEAWKECNRRLYHYYRALAPPLPDSFRQIEPLFLAVTCGCNAGLYHDALHEVYIPRIQRGDASFAANFLGARGALLSVLVHFFQQAHWGSVVETSEDQSLTAQDQLFILMQAALYLTATRGLGAPEALICYERAESLCQSLSRPELLYSALMGQWHYSLVTDKLPATMQIVQRIHSLAEKQNDPAQLMGAYRASACTSYFLGNFENAKQHALRSLQIWRSGAARSHVQEVDPPAVACLCDQALSEWHLGGIATCEASIAQAIAIAKQLKDMHGLAQALLFAGWVAHFERNPTEVQRLAGDVIEVATRYNFGFWLAPAAILSGWARSASGEIHEGIARIENGIRDYRATGSTTAQPFNLALKAEALHLTNRTTEALDAIREAEALVERSGERWWCAELHRLRGVFLTSVGADATKIEASFYEAIKIAREQKSISLEKRAEGTYAEYRRQKARALGGHGFRLPLW